MFEESSFKEITYREAVTGQVIGVKEDEIILSTLEANPKASSSSEFNTNEPGVDSEPKFRSATNWKQSSEVNERAWLLYLTRDWLLIRV